MTEFNDWLKVEAETVESEIIGKLSGNKVTALTRALRDVVKSVETNHNAGSHDD